MERDRESLDFELMGENYFAAIDARQEAGREEEPEGGFGCRLNARHHRARGNDAEAAAWEERARIADAERDVWEARQTTAQILADAARIREIRIEFAAGMAALDEKEAA